MPLRQWIHLPAAAFLARPRPRLARHQLAYPLSALSYFFDAVFEYRRDPLWGLYDIARAPGLVLESGEGDCVDWAKLAAALVYNQTDRPLSLYLALNGASFPPAHVLAYDGESVYSTRGGVTGETPREYADRTGRLVMLRRRVRGSAGGRVVL